MKEQNPKGWFLLASVVVALMVMAGDANPIAVWVMSAVGAFLAALPRRIRCRGEKLCRSTWQGCIVCFAAGLVMVLSLRMGHDQGQLVDGIMQGNVSSWAFGAAAIMTALLVATLSERGRNA